MSHKWGPIPTSAPAQTPAPAYALTLGQDPQSGDLDMMDRIMIVPEGARVIQTMRLQKQLWMLFEGFNVVTVTLHEGERAIPESLKLLQTQVLSHIACERFDVPRSPPPHPDDDDIELENDG
ncbi:hypothetical protein RND71_038501 [Anisodus tanguticus]|uniref:Uncharacterized protein n=1 Tax=Anisodus tanguticus TaxID=243964 RepID=A0AAE1UZI9_9SOLA|nr:hypothetical protein RND71_038501 [Anisodus tanguticus]